MNWKMCTICDVTLYSTVLFYFVSCDNSGFCDCVSSDPSVYLTPTNLFGLNRLMFNYECRHCI